MRLRIVDILQPVFQPAQEVVGVDQFFFTVDRKQSTLGEQRQDLESRPDSQCGVASAANELEDLRHELDFADAARAELDVLGAVPARHLAPNLCMQVAHGVDRAEVEVFAVDEGAHDVLQRRIPFRLQIVALVHHACPDPGVSFPLPALCDEIVLQRGK